MSLDTWVVCREPLPTRVGGWNLTVGPVRISELSWDEHGELAVEAGFRGVQLIHLGYHAIAGEAGDEMARILAEVSRGIVLYESGTEDREDFEPSSHRTLTAKVLEADLHAIVKDSQRERHVVQLAPDSGSAPGANDWSDL